MIDFRRTILTLCLHEVEFIVVGGVAAVLNGAHYTTLDLDIVHRRTPENIERLLLALKELGARYRARPDLSPQSTHLTAEGHQLLSTLYGPLDVLGAIEHGLDFEALLPNTKTVRISPDCPIPVLDLQTLIDLKDGATDPKHQQQLAILKQTLRETES